MPGPVRQASHKRHGSGTLDRLNAVMARLEPHVGSARAAKIRADYEESPGFGTPEQVAERLAERQEHGLGYAIHYYPEMAYDRSGVELFERTVMRELS
ncbi:hypothetical protein ACQUSY_12215 [Microbacterium sp. YY-03]|uniref:hypothetical protein n=1 Tax=Microbacterium sp. YY-03 TaxID=3421636 RepID=UPI003D16D9A9